MAKNVFEKIFYTGVGFAASAFNKLQGASEDFAEQSKAAEEEGKRIVEQLVSDTDARKEEFEEKVTRMIEDIVETFEFSKGGKNVDDLQARVEALETKLGVAVEADTPEELEFDNQKELID